ncbi:unnamed protein product, partial [Ilex paraguariensis]
DNSLPISVTPASSSAPTPCVPCVDSSPIIIPPITLSQPSSPELPLDVPPPTSSSARRLLTSPTSPLEPFDREFSDIMEIDKAIRESDDRRLKTKYNNAIYVIQRALALYSFISLEDVELHDTRARSFIFVPWLPLICGMLLEFLTPEDVIYICGILVILIEEVAFSFNGGKDSTVLLHLLRAGYFLHKAEQSHCNGDLSDCGFKFPIRTIYFESSSAFSEINSFTYETASTYNLQMDIIRLDFKSGLEALLKAEPIRAIFLGVRIGDPTAVGQEQFSPSSSGWPPFMRVNPILDWSYSYTSIGSVHDTIPNTLLCINNSTNNREQFRPAYLLHDGRLERAGRVKKLAPPVCGLFPAVSNGLKSVDPQRNMMCTASVIAVGDEILFGTVEDQLGPSLCRKLHSIGWAVSQTTAVRNDVDSLAEEVERQKSVNDMVFIYGGVGPLPSDVTVAGIAKAFGVRLAPDEEFEECLRHLMGEKCTGDRIEMAQLPESITELLHHEKLPVPLIKCLNVVILTATNISELNHQWGCLIELTTTSGLLAAMEPFVSKHFETTLSD